MSENSKKQNQAADSKSDITQAPSNQQQDALQIIPLGGLGEFGLNMMAYRYDDEIIIVDCGGMFPDVSLLGIDFVIPDMDYLIQNKDKVRALILTHAHEDHIGATPFFMRDISASVYGTEFTIAMLRRKLDEQKELHGFEKLLETIQLDTKLCFKNFEISFLHVNHSTAQAVSIVIRTKAGVVVHTGDFRIDSHPVQGAVFDYAGFANLGTEGVLALLSDSTNVERQGVSKSETEIADSFDELFQTCKGRLFISLFASSIPRIKTIFHLAKTHGRKVHVCGRSLIASTQVARELGLLDVNDSQLISEKEVNALEDHNVLVLLTGSQGEPRSALTRLAMNDHKEIHLHEGDTVIFSARVIPGRERAVSNIINHLDKHGAKVYYDHNHLVHTSGHAHSGELTTMLNLLKPKFFMPIHGEYHQLKTHSDLALKSGVLKDNIMMGQNGNVIQFYDDKAEVVDHVDTGRVYIDGKGVGDIGLEEIRARRKISQTGVVLAVLIISKTDGEILFGPELISKGFVFEEGKGQLYADGKAAVLAALKKLNKETMTDLDEVKEIVRLALRRCFNKQLERKPVVIPIVTVM